MSCGDATSFLLVSELLQRKNKGRKKERMVTLADDKMCCLYFGASTGTKPQAKHFNQHFRCIFYLASHFVQNK
jgi:hypothetical protein